MNSHKREEARIGETNVYGSNDEGWTLEAVGADGEWFNVSSHAKESGAIQARRDFNRK